MYADKLIEDGWITPYRIYMGSPYPLSYLSGVERQKILVKKKKLEAKVAKGLLIRHLFTNIFTSYSVRRNCKMVFYRKRDSPSKIVCSKCGKSVLEDSEWFYEQGKFYCGFCYYDEFYEIKGG